MMMLPLFCVEIVVDDSAVKNSTCASEQSVANIWTWAGTMNKGRENSWYTHEMYTILSIGIKAKHIWVFCMIKLLWSTYYIYLMRAM